MLTIHRAYNTFRAQLVKNWCEDWDRLKDEYCISKTKQSKKQLFVKFLFQKETVVKQEEFDLVNQSLLFLQKKGDVATTTNESTFVVATVAEPLVLETFSTTLQQSEDLMELYLSQHMSLTPTQALSKANGFLAELIFAKFLVDMACSLEGKPLSSHTLFKKYGKSFLDHYTLKVTDICYRHNGWQELFDQQNLTCTVFFGISPQHHADILCLAQKCDPLFDGPEYALITVGKIF